MIIGVIGSEGVVGTAITFGFEKLGHTVKRYDIVLKGSKLKDLIESDIIFVCLPSPTNQNDGSCDTSIIEKVLFEYYEVYKNYHLGYNDNKQIIAIKSTVTPGFLDKIRSYNFDFAIVPEFLRERCATTDFCENQDLCVIGCESKEVFETLKEAHGKFPKNVVHVTPDEASMIKLYNNAFNATRITFANAFYEVCKKYNINYTNVKNAVVNIKHIPDFYLDVNENFRGFGGMCLPKDLKSLNNLAEKANVKFFNKILQENSKYKVTVYPGMRK